MIHEWSCAWCHFISLGRFGVCRGNKVGCTYYNGWWRGNGNKGRYVGPIVLTFNSMYSFRRWFGWRIVSSLYISGLKCQSNMRRFFYFWLIVDFAMHGFVQLLENVCLVNSMPFLLLPNLYYVQLRGLRWWWALHVPILPLCAPIPSFDPPFPCRLSCLRLTLLNYLIGWTFLHGFKNFWGTWASHFPKVVKCNVESNIQFLKMHFISNCNACDPNLAALPLVRKNVKFKR